MIPNQVWNSQPGDWGDLSLTEDLWDLASLASSDALRLRAAEVQTSFLASMLTDALRLRADDVVQVLFKPFTAADALKLGSAETLSVSAVVSTLDILRLRSSDIHLVCVDSWPDDAAVGNTWNSDHVPSLVMWNTEAALANSWTQQPPNSGRKEGCST